MSYVSVEISGDGGDGGTRITGGEGALVPRAGLRVHGDPEGPGTTVHNGYVYGPVKVEIGELSNGDYGLAAYDPDSGGLVDLATLAFGLQADTVATAVTHTTGSFTDLSGSFGPEVTAIIGNTGRCLVTLSAQIDVRAKPNLGLSTGSGYMGFVLSGATSLSANFARSVYTSVSYDQFGSEVVPQLDVKTGASRVILLEGLNPGVHTFTTKYINFGDVTPGPTFSNRTIIVQPF